MASHKITIFGTNWCSDCRRTKKYLGEQRIHYEWRDIELETPEGEAAYNFVLAANEKIYSVAKRKIPVVQIFENGTESLLIEPSNVELAKHLGIAKEASSEFYDVVIVGGGTCWFNSCIVSGKRGL